MKAFLPSTALQADSQADTSMFSALPRSQRRRWLFLLHPLMVICAVQAALSLTLVWSNTAFSNEADYLRIGHLEWAHWRYGAPWPSAYAERFLSGSPFAYPPLGALADSMGGLPGARCLALGFMLMATVLLYLTASRLLGRGIAIVAAALWAFSEPAILQAFATLDPLATMLMALSAWLAVQVGYRRGRAALMTASAAALALANVTAYSSLVIDPVVIAFAFLVWLSCTGLLQALLRTVCSVAGLIVFFCVMVAASSSWIGLRFTVINHSGSDRQSILIVLSNIWAYSGLIISIAAIGMLIAVGTVGRRRSSLLVLLGCSALVVPAAQLRDQTSWSLDEHLGYGIWFAAMAASYACITLVRWLPGVGKQAAAACCVIALAYPAAKSWESAWNVYHAWPNARSFVRALRPVVANSRGPIYASGQDRIAEYYTSQGRDWTRWSTALSLNPGLPPSALNRYYTTRLRSRNYSVIALFYATTFSSTPGLTGSQLVQVPHGSGAAQELLGLVGDEPGELGLPALTLALEKNPEYRLAALGPYNSARVKGVYAIWLKKAQT